MKNKRVVVSGIGIISSLGKGKEVFLENFLNTNSQASCKIGDFDAVSILGQGGIRTLDRCSLLSLCAAKKAIDDANIQLTQMDLSNMGVSFGTMGGISSGFDFYRTKLLENPRYVNPMQFPNTVVNASAGQIAIRFKLSGFNATISTGSCAGLDAIIYAAWMLKKDKADIVLSGGAEEYSQEVNLAFKLAKDEELSEAAAILALESLDSALRRKADILAEIKGFAQNMQLSSRDYAGKIKEVIMQALVNSNKEISDIDCIFSNDNRSLSIIKGIFNSAKFYLLKEKFGNLNSASGAVSAVISSLLIKDNHYKNILINASSCVGHHSSLIISKFNAE